MDPSQLALVRALASLQQTNGGASQQTNWGSSPGMVSAGGNMSQLPQPAPPSAAVTNPLSSTLGHLPPQVLAQVMKKMGAAQGTPGGLSGSAGSQLAAEGNAGVTPASSDAAYSAMQSPGALLNAPGASLDYEAGTPLESAGGGTGFLSGAPGAGADWSAGISSAGDAAAAGALTDAATSAAADYAGEDLLGDLALAVAA